MVKFKKFLIVETLLDTYNPTIAASTRRKIHKLTHTKQYNGAVELFKQFLKSPEHKKTKNDDGHTELFRIAHDLELNYKELYSLAVKKGMINK